MQRWQRLSAPAAFDTETFMDGYGDARIQSTRTVRSEHGGGPLRPIDRPVSTCARLWVGVRRERHAFAPESKTSCLSALPASLFHP